MVLCIIPYLLNLCFTSFFLTKMAGLFIFCDLSHGFRSLYTHLLLSLFLSGSLNRVELAWLHSDGLCPRQTVQILERQGAALGCHWPKSLVCSMVRGYKASQCLFELVWTPAESLADVYLQAFDSLAFLHCILGLCPISPKNKKYHINTVSQNFKASVKSISELFDDELQGFVVKTLMVSTDWIFGIFFKSSL